MKKLSDRNKIQKLVEIVRKMDAEGPVCDSTFKCKKRQEMEDTQNFTMLANYEFCPYCGKEINLEKD